MVQCVVGVVLSILQTMPLSLTDLIWPAQSNPIKKLKLMNFTNWKQMTKVEFGSKVIKLQVESSWEMLAHPTFTPRVVSVLPDKTGNYDKTSSSLQIFRQRISLFC